MSEIPEETEWSKFSSDILNGAAEHVEHMPHRPPFKADVMLAIAKAIWAERQRCAKMAEKAYRANPTGSGFDNQPARSTAHDIWQAILNQTEE